MLWSLVVTSAKTLVLVIVSFLNKTECYERCPNQTSALSNAACLVLLINIYLFPIAQINAQIQ